MRTYVQSGNVVFRSLGAPTRLVQAIEEGIRGTLGLDVTVLLRTKGELAEVVGRSPFAASGIDPVRLHVTFLVGDPDPDRVADLAGKRVEPDELHVAGREVYLHCPNGYGRTKLQNAFLERQLAVAATTRNWKTVTALAELANA